jgi:hypothetical protein
VVHRDVEMEPRVFREERASVSRVLMAAVDTDSRTYWPCGVVGKLLDSMLWVPLL